MSTVLAVGFVLACWKGFIFDTYCLGVWRRNLTVKFWQTKRFETIHLTCSSTSLGNSWSAKFIEDLIMLRTLSDFWYTRLFGCLYLNIASSIDSFLSPFKVILQWSFCPDILPSSMNPSLNGPLNFTGFKNTLRVSIISLLHNLQRQFSLWKTESWSEFHINLFLFAGNCWFSPIAGYLEYILIILHRSANWCFASLMVCKLLTISNSTFVFSALFRLAHNTFMDSNFY